MSLQHFFLDDQVLEDETQRDIALQLSPDDAKHAKVLRLQPGEHIAVVDAAADYFECEIVDALNGLTVRIAQKGGGPKPAPNVTLLQGVSKGDKMDEVIRHATELGVRRFVPLLCERSVVKLDAKKTATRVERWQAIAKSAAMQSGQIAVPAISQPLNVPDACASIQDADCVLVCWEQADSTGIREALDAAKAACGKDADQMNVSVAVGPEGGFTKLEVERFLSATPAACVVTLGPSILRTETAGVVAPALTLFELGGLQ